MRHFLTIAAILIWVSVIITFGVGIKTIFGMAMGGL